MTALDDLSAQAHAQLVAMIDGLDWRNGGRLPPETELATRFGVSRPTLKKALARLRNDGRLISRRGSGNFVQPRVTVGPPEVEFHTLSIRTVYDMRRCMRFRQVIECAAAGDAAELCAPAGIARLEATHDRLAWLPAGQSVFDADFGFHLAVAAGSGNAYYEIALQTLRSQIALGAEFGRKLRGVSPDEVSPRVLEEHGRILDAIRSGSQDAAHRAMKWHISQGIRRLFGDDVYSDEMIPNTFG